MAERRSEPSPRIETLRRELRAVLHETPRTTRELSQALGVSEREVLAHLPHVARSLANSDERLAVEPARCLACGFEFAERTRVTRPGRCPACKSTRISQPRFSIVPG